MRSRKSLREGCRNSLKAQGNDERPTKGRKAQQREQPIARCEVLALLDRSLEIACPQMTCAIWRLGQSDLAKLERLAE